MQRPSVWVISPHSSTLRVVGLNLSRRGLCVLEVSPEGGAALPDGRPDLIVLDVDPPDGSGWGVADRLRQTPRLAGVPLLLLVATAPGAGRLRRLHPVSWVEKPLSVGTLLARAQEGLDSQGRRQEMNASRETLAERVRAIPGGEHLYMCYSCGTCVASCMVQPKIEPLYNPRRLIQKVMNGLEEQVYEDKTTWLCSACDLCYPACPQEIHVSEVLAAVRELAIRNGHTSTLATAVVDESTCVACGLCTLVCPYDAVALVEKRRAGRAQTVASVDPNHCMACGLCAANCRSASIELPDQFSNEVLMGDLWDWMQRTEAVRGLKVGAPAWPAVNSGPGIEAEE